MLCLNFDFTTKWQQNLIRTEYGKKKNWFQSYLLVHIYTILVYDGEILDIPNKNNKNVYRRMKSRPWNDGGV